MSPRHRKTIVSCSLHNFLAFPPRTVPRAFPFFRRRPLCSGNPRKQKPNCRPVRDCKEARATNENLVTPRFFHARSRCFPLAILAEQRLINRRSTHRASLRSELLLFGYLAIFALKLLHTRLSFTFCRLDIARSSKIPPRDRHSAAFSIWNTEDRICERSSIARTRGPATILSEIPRDGRSSYYHLCVE